MSFPDAALFLIFASLVGCGCWRLASCSGDRYGTAAALFAALWGVAGTLIWLVGQFWLSGLSCGVIFAVLLGLLWLAPVPARGASVATATVPPALGGLDRMLLAYLALVSALTLFFALSPPTASDYDSLVYHLAVPAQYLRAGRVVALPYDHHSYFPLTLEMLYAAGLAWRGAIFAKLFHWLMLPIGAALIHAIGRRHLSARAGLLGAALWVSLPVVQSEAATAYIDLGLAVFSLGAVFCFLNWHQTANPRWMAACGLFCGLCLGSKYLGALVCIWLAVWIIVLSLREKRSLRSLGPAVVLALVIGGGWYLRNWLLTGNPVYPFAFSIFGGKGWTADMAAAYAADQKAFGFGHGPLDLLQLPWRLSFSPLNLRPSSETATYRFETAGMILSSILGPALLAFGAPLIGIRRKPFAVGFALWTIVFLFSFWALTGQYLRYLLPAYALGSLACGWGVRQYLQGGPVLRWAAGLTLIAWLGFAPALTYYQDRGRLPVILGAETAADYLRGFPGYDAMSWASNNTPPNARFAVWGEPRCFYLQRDYFWADKGHNTLIDYDAPLLPQLKKLGATHVLVNEDAATNAGFGEVPAAWVQLAGTGAATELYASRGYRVYELK